MMDIRWPIGLMFSLVGALLAVFGVITRHSPETYKCSLGINMNLLWGIILFCFGSLMLTFARRSARLAKGQGQ